MITEDYVSFETAKLLEEKGFNRVVFKNSPHYAYNADGQFSGPSWDAEYPAPTLQMAMKWLREVHNVFIDISSRFSKNADNDVCFSYSCKKLIDAYKNSYEIGDGEWLNYEEACEAAIKYCLENLI